jgi:hypothetical protein
VAKLTIVEPLQIRILLLPLIWGVFGIGEVLVLSYLYGPVATNIPYPANDKPIGGSYLPVLFFNFGALIAVISFSLYSLGIWNIDFSSRKIRIDLVAFAVMFASGMLVFYYAIFLFPLAVALVYFLATNIE